MEKAHSRKKGEDKIEKLIKESFGMDDDTLLQDFLSAQIEVRDNQIPPEPENGFQTLLQKIEERGLKACGTDVTEATSRLEERKNHRRLKPMLKVALAAAVIAIMMMAMGISAGARRSYSYTVRQRDSVRNDIVLNNVDVLSEEDPLNSAYNEIWKKTGINVLKLAYIPSGMQYIKTDFLKRRAIMYFEYQNTKLKVVQQSNDTEMSVNIISDRNKKHMVYNDWLEKNILIEEAEVETGQIEYSTCIITEDAYYQLSGVMEKTDFCEIVKNVYLEN